MKEIKRAPVFLKHSVHLRTIEPLNYRHAAIP